MRRWRPLLTVVLLLGVRHVVELKTGERVEGAFKGADATSVRIEIGSQVLTFKPEQVRAIYYGAAPGRLTRDPTPGARAIEALKGLQSVTTNSAGLSYDQYAARVLDAKVLVDRYMEQVPSNDAARDSIRDAMHFYVLGSSALETNRENRRRRMGTEVTEISPDKTFEVCPQAQQFMKTHKLRDGVTVLWTMDVMPVIWSCAADKITEVEKVLAK